MSDPGAIIIGLWAIVIALSAMAGARKGHGVAGAFLGLFLGLLGLIIALFLPATHDVQVQREAQRIRVRAEAGKLAAGEPVTGHAPGRMSSWAARRWEDRP